MAAPIHNIEEEVVVISDEEEEAQVSQKGFGGRGTVGNGGNFRQRVEELLDYDDDVDEAVLLMQRGEVTKSGPVPRVVQGDHSGAHRRDLVAARGEEGLFGSLGLKEVASGALTELVLCGLWDTHWFAGRRSKLHHIILGGNWD
ncbi:hypothetical protein NDU88_002372 [Pleurodeles waltl]|uniref:Uncharacterized protein n=1 Tax=Pleurodeles waltl TaxID=8319 RepID=A0AAV7QCG3_PLEWA|nr:hypothetical protein NDU88_002372 [Pleurodeles waltl]